MMTLARKDAFDLLKARVENENLIKHCIAVEAIMRRIANFLGEDEEVYGIVGLLHDIDYEETKDKPESHGLICEEILRNRLEKELIETIKSHNFEKTGVEPSKKIDFALIASDAVSGLIIACALVMPSKKLGEVRVETVDRKFKQKDFARRCRRDLILFCERIGIDRRKFFEIALDALKSVCSELGL